MIDVMRTAGKAQLVSWTEARLAEGSQDAWARGSLVGVAPRADGTLGLVDPLPPVFSRSSVAYLSNGQQVAAGQPRFETVGGRTGLLIEEATTNLRAYSDLSDTPASSGPAGEITVSMVVAVPLLNYQTQVRRISRTGSTTWAFAEWDSGISISAAHAVSIYIKADTMTSGESSRLMLIEVNANPQRYTYVSIDWGSGGTISGVRAGSSNNWSNPTAYGFIPVGGGWYRVWLVCPADVNPGMTPRVRIAPCEISGAVTDKAILVGGVQVEQRAYPTSLVPTAGAAATRAAEMLTVPTAGVLFPQEGTIGVWSYVPSVVIDGSTIFWHTTDAGAAYPRPNTIRLQRGSDGKYRVVLTDATMQQTSLVTPNVVSEGWHFFAVRWSAQEAALFLDGVKVASATNPRIPQAVATEFILGSGLNGVGKPFANINSFLGPVRISRRARTDQEIADAYAAGTLELDEDTTILLPLSGSLAYGRGGYRIAPAVDLSRVGLVYASRLEWEADDAGVEVQTSLDGGQTWQQAQNGGPVPSIVPGQDVTGKTLLVKQCLLAQDMAAAPVLRRLGARVISEPRLAKHQGRVELLGGG